MIHRVIHLSKGLRPQEGFPTLGAYLSEHARKQKKVVLPSMQMLNPFFSHPALTEIAAFHKFIQRYGVGLSLLLSMK